MNLFEVKTATDLIEGQLNMCNRMQMLPKIKPAEIIYLPVAISRFLCWFLI